MSNNLPNDEVSESAVPSQEQDAPSHGSSTTKERSSWSRRLELFQASVREGSVPEEYPGRSGGADRKSDSEDWEAIASPSSLAELQLEPNVDTLPTGASRVPAWPDPEGLDLHLAAARRESADREAENTGLRGALGAAHQQLRGRETEIADLTTRLAVATATTHARQDELSALSARYKGTEEKLAALEHELELLRNKLQRGAEESDKRQAQIENLRATRTTLEETLKARDRVISARDEELGASEQELQALRDRLSMHQKSIADRDTEMALLADQLLLQQERSRALEAEIGGREQVVANQREKLAERDEQLASLLATLDVVERTLARRPGVEQIAGAGEPMRLDAHSRAADVAPASEFPLPLAAPSFSDDFDSVVRDAPSYNDANEEETDEGDAPAEEPKDSAEDIFSADSDESHDSAPGANESEALSTSDRREGIETDLEADREADAEPQDEAADEPVEAEALAAADTEASEDAGDVPDTESDDGAEDYPAPIEDESTSEAGDEANEDAVEAPSTDAESTPEGDTPALYSVPPAYEAELNVLGATGDIFAQRPPPQPAIFRWWRDQKIASVEGIEATTFDELAATTVASECAERSEETISILSLCGADPEFEIRLGRALLAAGHSNFVIDCIDDRLAWHDERATAAEAAGLSDKIDSLPASYDSIRDDKNFDVFIADGSLQQVADPTAWFARIQQVWKESSVMVVGAALSASSAGANAKNIESVDRIWNVMSDRYMKNHLTDEEQTHFVASSPASDAPGNGGPLSPPPTPILPLFLDNYAFETFAAFGNLINAFVGPEVGPNFDPADETDTSFIDRYSQLDEALIDAGALHPVHMVAVVRNHAGDDAVMLENRPPERCLMLEQPAEAATEEATEE